MAKSKKKHYPKKTNIKQTVNKSNKKLPTENKNVYTQEYLDYKREQQSQKPMIMRILVVILALVIILGFVISPLF